MGGIAVTPRERATTEPFAQKNKGVMTTGATLGADSNVYVNTDMLVVVVLDTEPSPTSNVVGAVKNATLLQHVVFNVVLLLNISAYELSRPPVVSRNAQ